MGKIAEYRKILHLIVIRSMMYFLLLKAKTIFFSYFSRSFKPFLNKKKANKRNNQLPPISD